MMKSPAPFIALSLALLVSACGSTGNMASNTTSNSANTINSSVPSNTSNSANTSNTSNTSNSSASESGSHPTDQIDSNAKIENGKTITRGDDITLTIPADWKKDKLSNDYADWYTGKTKDGKDLTLIVLWKPTTDEYKGLSTPEAVMKDMRMVRESAEKDPERYTLPRMLKLLDRVGVAYDRKSTTPDGVDEWEWRTYDSADFEKGITFRYPAASFDHYKSLRDGIINSLKIKRGPRMPSM